MKIDDVFLSGLGVMQPDTMSATDAVAQGLYDEATRIENGLTAVCIAGDMAPADMAVHAARHAYERSGDDPARLGMIFHASVYHQGPEMWLPAYYIQRELVSNAIPAFEIRMGCSGMVAALELAACRLGAMSPNQTVLVTAADNLNSPLFDRWSVPGFIAADAGSALVLSRGSGFARLASAASIAVPELEPMHRGGEPMFPPGATDGRKIDLTARAVHFRDNFMPLEDAAGLAAVGLQRLVNQVLTEADTKLVDIKKLIYVNAAGYFIEHLVLKPLGITVEQTTWEFGKGIGHAGASDHVLSLNHLLTTGQLEAGDRLLLVSSAPGYSSSCAVIEILNVPSWAT